MITALLVITSASLIGSGLSFWYFHKQHKSLYADMAKAHFDVKSWFEQSVGHLKEVLEEKAKETEHHAESIKTVLEDKSKYLAYQTAERALDIVGAFENTFEIHSDRLTKATDHLKTQANNLKDEAVQNAVARAPRTAPNRSL